MSSMDDRVEQVSSSLWTFSLNLGVVGISYQFSRKPGKVAEMLGEEIEDPLTLLLHKSLHVVDFVNGQVTPPRKERFVDVTVDQLRRQLGPGNRVPRQPQPLKVTGVLSTAVLLNAGWWERVKPGSTPVGRNDIQRWAYTGFEEWGPSWDFTSEGRFDNDAFFLGQLGKGDEANSLLVVAVGERGRNIRNGIVPEFEKRGVGAISVEVTGLLCHRSHLRERNPELASIAGRWQGEFNYCLLLTEDHHRVTPVYEVPDYYSAYLWQCFYPKESVGPDGVPKLNDCYIVWEHTDLTKPGAIAYNLDGLRHKAEYISREFGEMALLQKSGPLVPGAPQLSSVEFQRLLGAIGRSVR